MNQSVQLAKLWLGLNSIKTTLDNEIIPISIHLQMDDEDLLTAMELLSEEIGNSFERFRLVACPRQKEE